MISTMIYQLTKDASIKELKDAGLASNYAEHGMSQFPTNADGVPFTTAYFAAVGDPIADLSEDMAAEQKARAVYENLIDLTNDPDVIGPLLWLRQREVVHYNRFKELFDYYQNKMKNSTNMDASTNISQTNSIMDNISEGLNSVNNFLNSYNSKM